MAKTSVIGMGFRRMDDGRAAGIWRDIERMTETVAIGLDFELVITKGS